MLVTAKLNQGYFGGEEVRSSSHYG